MVCLSRWGVKTAASTAIACRPPRVDASPRGPARISHLSARAALPRRACQDNRLTRCRATATTSIACRSASSRVHDRPSFHAASNAASSCKARRAAASSRPCRALSGVDIGEPISSRRRCAQPHRFAARVAMANASDNPATSIQPAHVGQCVAGWYDLQRFPQVGFRGLDVTLVVSDGRQPDQGLCHAGPVPQRALPCQGFEQHRTGSFEVTLCVPDTAQFRERHRRPPSANDAADADAFLQQ